MKSALSVFFLLLCASFGAEEEPALANLRKNYKTGLAQAQQTLHRQYQEALIQLKGQYTRAAQLEAALAVEAELKKLAEITRQSGADPSVVQRLLGHKWQWWEDQSIEFHADGKGLLRQPNVKDADCQWQVTPDGTIIFETSKDKGKKYLLTLKEGYMEINEGKGKAWAGRYLGPAK